MTLNELSPAYRESAELIGQRLAELRLARRETRDEKTRAALQRRILDLKPLYTQCRELAVLTAHYYDRSFTRHEKYTL